MAGFSFLNSKIISAYKKPWIKINYFYSGDLCRWSIHVFYRRFYCGILRIEILWCTWTSPAHATPCIATIDSKQVRETRSWHFSSIMIHPYLVSVGIQFEQVDSTRNLFYVNDFVDTYRYRNSARCLNVINTYICV